MEFWYLMREMWESNKIIYIIKLRALRASIFFQLIYVVVNLGDTKMEVWNFCHGNQEFFTIQYANFFLIKFMNEWKSSSILRETWRIRRNQVKIRFKLN